MFRRLPSGLPIDPVFVKDLKGLGYHVNEDDEIRSIEKPKEYFKFFLTKNERYNALQREGMNEAIRDIVSERLEKLGLQKIRLPLGASANEPNVPIFISSNLREAKRIVILFYEPKDDIGVLAHRIIGGPGGINQGSAVNLVEALQANTDSPGIILANLGQLRWWRRGKKAVTPLTWNALPAKSAVEGSLHFDENKNTIPGNRTTAEHVEYVFNHVVMELANPTAKIQVIGVSAGTVDAIKFLDENWEKWGGRLSAFASLAPYIFADELTNAKFARWFVDRGRAYINHDEPDGCFLADYDGSNKRHQFIPAFGCPVFSLGVPYYSEVLLPTGYPTIVKWFEEVFMDPNYENPHFVRIDNGEDEEETRLRELDDAGAEAYEKARTGMSDWAGTEADPSEKSVETMAASGKGVKPDTSNANVQATPNDSDGDDAAGSTTPKATQVLKRKVDDVKAAVEDANTGESSTPGKNLVQRVAQVLGLGSKSDETKDADCKEAKLMAAKLKAAKQEAADASAAKSKAIESKAVYDEDAWNARLRGEED